MSELQTGTLKLKTKKNKPKIDFSYITSDGQYRALDFKAIPKEQISIALLEKIEQATSNLTLTVEFETDGDRVLQLREQGLEWDRQEVQEIQIPQRDRPQEHPKNVWKFYAAEVKLESVNRSIEISIKRFKNQNES